jgi:hypothetical protein
MADINNVTLNSQSLDYTITYTKERPNNNQMTYHFSISALMNPLALLSGVYALLCTVTVNGVSSQTRFLEEGDTWLGSEIRVRNVSVTCPSNTAETAQTVVFSVVSDGSVPTNTGVINNSSYWVTSLPLLPTVCFPPAACSLDVIVAETEAILSWSGAGGGIHNDITGYEIQYSESNNNTTWGAWTALTIVESTATSGNITVAPSATRGYYRRFRVRTRGTAGEAYYSGYTTSSNSVRRNLWPIQPTLVTALPTSYTNETITVTWSGASSPTSSIKGYMIARRSSMDNATWSSWVVTVIFDLAATGGSRIETPLYVPGIYLQYGVWTIDIFDIYSSEEISNSVFCELTVCGAPTSCTISATLAENDVTLSWSGASGGVGNDIMAYEVEYSDSTDNVNWGSWTALTVVNTTDTFGTLVVSPPASRGNYRRFRVRTRGTIGEVGYSGWIESDNSVRRKRLTPAPTVTAPNDSSITYNPSPRVLITTGIEPDGQLQIVEVKTDDGEWLNSVDNAELFSVGGELGDNVNTIFIGDGALSYGSHTINIRCYDSATLTRNTEVTRIFIVLPSPFEEITANVTKVKAEHIISLRTVADNICGYYNMPSYSWSSNIIARKTQIRDWAYHIIEIRAAIDGIIDSINDFNNNTIFPVVWLPLGTGRPRADVTNQLYDSFFIL